MSSKTSDRIQRSWFKSFCRTLRAALADRLSAADPVILHRPSEVKVEETMTGGWSAQLGRVRGDRASSVEVWLDYWPRTNSRKLYISYYTTSIELVRQLALATRSEFGDYTSLPENSSARNRDSGIHQLIHPLPKNLYDRPVIEVFRDRSNRAYFGYYFNRTPTYERPVGSRVLERSVAFMEVACRAAVASLSPDLDSLDYPAIENRKKVRSHLQRDRSPKLAKFAKLRDGYRCQICGFSFLDTYGTLGQNYAEAHHRVALGARKGVVVNTADDLVTVCANCHRMLHKMSGTTRDVARLKRILANRAAV